MKQFTVNCAAISDVEITLISEGVEFERRGTCFTCQSIDNYLYDFIKEIPEVSLKEVTEEIKKKVEREEIFHKEFDHIIKWLDKGWAVYLHGPAGTGKSQIAEQVAKFYGLDFYPESTLLSQFDLTNFVDANGHYEESNFYKALKYGGLFFLDEFDGCVEDVPIKLNGCLANKYFKFPNGEIVKMHSNFKCICAGNTVGLGATEQYVGRHPMDASTLNRFRRIHVDYDERIELRIAEYNKELVEFYRDFRNAVNECHINHIVSYRELKALVDGLSMEDERQAIIDALSADEWCLGKDNMKHIYMQMTTSRNKYTQVYSKIAYEL